MGGEALPSLAPQQTSRWSGVTAGVRAYGKQVWVDHIRLVLYGIQYALRPHTVLTLVASCVCVWLCAPNRLALSWDSNFQVIVFGLVFPLTYSIQENFRRRERCADVIAELTGSAVGLMWMHRDMDRGVRAAGEPPRCAELPTFRPSQRRSGSTAAGSLAPAVAPVSAVMQPGTLVHNAYVVLQEFLSSTRLYLTTGDEDEATVLASHARAIRALSTLSALNEALGDAAGYSKGGEGGISRAHQYTRYLLVNLEQLRILRSYSGSPHGMRYFCSLMTHVSPLLLAPYFRHFCNLNDEVCVAGHFSAVMYGVVLCTLYSVSVDIEDLCDGQGMDDIIFNTDVELRDASRLLPFEATPAERSATPLPPPLRPVPLVRVRYDDCLGTVRSSALVEPQSERLFAHRDPSRRMRVSETAPAEASPWLPPPPPPGQAATQSWDSADSEMEARDEPSAWRVRVSQHPRSSKSAGGNGHARDAWELSPPPHGAGDEWA